MRLRTAIAGTAGALVVALVGATPGASVPTAGTTAATVAAEDEGAALERVRRSGDLIAQRDHAWRVFGAIVASTSGSATSAFETWYGEDRTFAAAPSLSAPAGLRDFARDDSSPATAHGAVPAGDAAGSNGAESADTPPLAYTLYNRAAYEHLRAHRLHERRALDRLRAANGPRDAQGRRAVPPFPRGSIVVKSAWWPAAGDRPTPLPVWDAARNPAQRLGNAPFGWARIVVVDPARDASDAGTSRAAESRDAPRAPDDRAWFAGEGRDVSAHVPLEQFHYVTVDAALVSRLARDATFRRLTAIVLGRPLHAGDRLLLVGLHFATREIDDWIWGTAWWHDAPDTGPFAQGRPRSLDGAWRHYLVDVAFDASRPVAPDGGPRVTFNPWLEARFPDGGHGGGTASNCMACHRRASYPGVAFLPVTRGEPDVQRDPAFARDRLATNSLWSVALHSRP